ncbi:MAG: hypothetical protein AB7P07_03785 [Hyphomonadaceae bacterium]
MRFLIVLAACVLSACAFTSEVAYLDDSDAVFPFADGETRIWIEDGEAERRLRFAREGAGYRVFNEDDPMDAPLRVMFAAIPETPEADYLLQMRLREDEEGLVYAFMWRTEQGFAVASAPRAVLSVNDKLHPGVSAYCEWRQYGECALKSAESLAGLYRQFVYPRYVSQGAVPEDIIMLEPQP